MCPNGSTVSLRLVYATGMLCLRICIFFLFGALLGCAHYPVNAPLQEAQAINPVTDRQRGDDATLIVVSFSGGGTRAAALAYGALQTLSATRLPNQRRLLDEVDLISSVSGGSFTAAYYGLHGDGLFSDFESRVLKRDIQSPILLSILWPGNWADLLSDNYGRSELAADYMDEHIFRGAVFGDMRSDVPTIQINATDVSRVRQFAFSHQQFALICSDLNRFPVSRAVAASSAIPLVATSVVLHNRAGQCGARPPEWVDPVLRNLVGDLRLTEEAVQVASYLDSHERPFMHLLDGGLADNLGLRGAMERVGLTGDQAMQKASPWLRNVRRVVFIVINAERPPSKQVDRISRPLEVGATVSSASDVPVLRYNVETRLLLRQRLDAWRKVQHRECLRKGHGNCQSIETHLVEVDLGQISDLEQRRRLQAVPTRMGLQSGVVDELVAQGAILLARHPAYQSLVKAMTREGD